MEEYSGSGDPEGMEGVCSEVEVQQCRNHFHAIQIGGGMYGLNCVGGNTVLYTGSSTR